MSDQRVLTKTEYSVTTIKLNRPEVLNALDILTSQALVRAIEECQEDERVRVMILTGDGQSFSAGGDMKAVWEHIQAGGNPRHYLRDLSVFLHRGITDLRLMDKPVIAAINGIASGAGFSFAAACDLRIAGESARFKQAFTSIGLAPDSGWTVFVPHLIGRAKAEELLLLDPMLNASQALEIGLVHEVVPNELLMKHAMEVAIRLSQGPATALARTKKLLNSVLFPNLEVQLEQERQCIIAQAGTMDFMERLTAFIEKRTVS